MKYDPIHHYDVMRAMHDPEVRGAGAGVAVWLYIIGGLLLFGPIIWWLVKAFWAELLVGFAICLILTVITVFQKK